MLGIILHRDAVEDPDLGPAFGAARLAAAFRAIVALAATPLISVGLGATSHVFRVQAVVQPLCTLFILSRPGLPAQTAFEADFRKAVRHG
ncbi:MAG: hypothetical protein JJT99_00905 [Rhodobacteraceae bacterium]|nr:hypothetical protein [Paracoccaceae bacterium]